MPLLRKTPRKLIIHMTPYPSSFIETQNTKNLCFLFSLRLLTGRLPCLHMHDCCVRERGVCPPQPSWKSLSLFLNLQSQLKKLSLILAYKLRPHRSFCPSLLHHTQSLALFPFYCLLLVTIPDCLCSLKTQKVISLFISSFSNRDSLSLSACLFFHKGVLVQWIGIWWSSSHWFVSFLCLFQNHLILRKECLQMPL